MILNEINLFIIHFTFFTKQIPTKMFSLRVFFIFWLSSSVIMLGKGVQGSFPFNSFGEVEEHVSHDSASWNSRDLYNPPQNVHVDERNHIVPSAYPVNSDFSNQMTGEENINWVEESPLVEWFNHPDSLIQYENQQEPYHGSMFPHENTLDQYSNFQEAMNYYHHEPWNLPPVESSSFSGQNHQKKTHPHAGSFQDQGTSSYTVQPMYDGNFHDGYHLNFAPNNGEFRHADSPFESQANQNLETPHDEPMTENPALMQNDFHLLEIRNRVYQNHDPEALNLDSASSSYNSGPMSTVTEIERMRNSLEYEHMILTTSKKRLTRKQLARLEVIRSNIEMIDLAKILKKEFSTCPKETAQKFANYFYNRFQTTGELKKLTEKNVDKEIPAIIYGDEDKEDETSNKSALFRRKTFLKMDMVFQIQWEDSDKLIGHISQFAAKFSNHLGEAKNECTQKHITKISIMGIVFMKIIAKKYSKYHDSIEFGDDKSLINYTKKFWNHCFSNDEDMNEGLIKFFMSIRSGILDCDMQTILLTGFSKNENTPDKIFPSIRDGITSAIHREKIYLFSWYFCCFRTIVYYSELILSPNYVAGNHLKKIIEGGLYFFQEENNSLHM
ncbi:hypothetical protein PPACK8108_LOCUS9192 [Phakopsora pachyrhizi]|uniref:Uncharacterized protein n=1 Tax=Phakopsora pachyrhizi TaxID=170000 RepID=A0AAV0AW01_PHAPC|nr:hypothetical protein PPACK8108_LOCUS9192 [Phakopsora pachyrhizi]